MSKLITNTIRHTGGSADNITLDNSQNVIVEAKLTVANKDDDNVNVLEVKNDNGNVSGGFTQASDGDGQVFCKKNDGTNTVLFRSDGNSHITGGKVGIGTTSPSDVLHIKHADAFIMVDRTSNEAGISLRVGDSNSTRSNIATQTNGDLAIDTANTERLRVLAGGGLTFNGDTSAANALNDYEEGTFTPRLGGASNIGTYNVTGVGAYVKIGKMVTVTFHFYDKDLDNNAAGAVYIDQMPFTSKTGSTVGGISDNFHTEKVDFMEDRRYTWYISGNDTKLKGLYSTDGSGWANWQVADFESSGMYMEVQCSYMTA